MNVVARGLLLGVPLSGDGEAGVSMFCECQGQPNLEDKLVNLWPPVGHHARGLVRWRESCEFQQPFGATLLPCRAKGQVNGGEGKDAWEVGTLRVVLEGMETELAPPFAYAPPR